MVEFSLHTLCMSITLHYVLACTTNFRCPSHCMCSYPNQLMDLFKVDCSESELIAAPTSLPRCTDNMDYSLRYHLNLSSNLIREFKNIGYVQETHTLDLSLNFISHVDNLTLNTSLRKLYMHKNQIQTISKDSKWIANIETVTLHENPWRCDCSLAWLQKWLNAHPTKTINLELIKCHEPEHLRHRPIMNATYDEFCSVNTNSAASSSKLQGWEITLIVLGVIVYLIIISLLAFCYVLRQRVKIQIQNQHELRDVNNLSVAQPGSREELIAGYNLHV